MPEKPTLMWHADKDGKCHRGCEARREDPQGTWYCVICNLFPWTTFRGPAGDGVLCPFALLSSVLCCGKEEEKPAEEIVLDVTNPPMCDSCWLDHHVRSSMQLVRGTVAGTMPKCWRCPVCKHETKPWAPAAKPDDAPAPITPMCTCQSRPAPVPMIHCEPRGEPPYWRCHACGRQVSEGGLRTIREGGVVGLIQDRLGMVLKEWASWSGDTDMTQSCALRLAESAVDVPREHEPDDVVERCCRVAFATVHASSSTIVSFDRLQDGEKNEYRAAIRAALAEARR